MRLPQVGDSIIHPELGKVPILEVNIEHTAYPLYLIRDPSTGQSYELNLTSVLPLMSKEQVLSMV
jgi:predicted secreted protein